MTDKLLVLYQISNAKEPRGLYNAFEMKRDYHSDGSGGVTLAAVKNHCHALRSLSHAGPDGYHWRVRVDDRAQGNSSKPLFSWWDIQDENARLPIKENVAMSEVERLYMNEHSRASAPPDTGTAVASDVKGALRSLGKAMKEVTGGGDSSRNHVDDNSPKVNVIAFKLLDMVKVIDEFSGEVTRPKHRAQSKPSVQASRPSASRTPKVPPATTSQTRQPAPPPQTKSTNSTNRGPPQRRTTGPIPRVAPPKTAGRTTSHPRAPHRPAPPQPAPVSRQPSANLMSFDAPKASYHRSNTAPSAVPESRAEKLKREYQQKKQEQNRVWDEVDQRWVAVEATNGTIKQATTSAPPSATSTTKKKEIGIKIDARNAIGKSSTVQAAVHQRVNEMKTAQEQAIKELKDREKAKKDAEEEEDVWRKKLEPKLKAWSEEHGKKKRLRALLASLHLILWEGSGWKQVSLGDILNDKKARRCYLKATLKVHPDKTKDLDAEKRFIAKRVFDALSQAMTEFENNGGAT
mmetsp:Transcript_14253/g.17965  ORF Transcript_14253/g.17965 Transcript_14253/m.17965 type:complete len:517 (+) Transcript_14253:48-1598(+)|eukprot:CAMPEP_0172498890 /NCGR_PEP_ID=MMETSP1066-20121228/119119_1 /TAXON_ID=671091 /ORGANISM="Coscinodiscus wailesii, Strain CCMP2513" /LENGTH=516 /DNA_ID=CAMNT_0013272353 /DNA_START=46 /DNA_END=1596 /DNA_ORIENTATION=+